MKIEVKNGKFGYTKDVYVHENVNFCLEEGKVLTVLGPNGIGKTTLLKCITGLLDWTEGATCIDGQNIKSIPSTELWKRIGYVPQAGGSKFAYSLLDMVLMGRASHLKIYSTPGKKDKEAAMQALDMMGMADKWNRPCTQISGGEYQLVSIARALVSEPELLILDEPESHLDFRNQLLVLETVEKVVSEKHLSCIINTHYPEHAVRLGDVSLMIGKNLPYIFSNTNDVITEENLSKYFGVNVKICSFELNNKKFSSIVPLALKSGNFT